ncbi:MAG: MarR family transcriptional regulator [Rhodospirillales bacterium]
MSDENDTKIYHVEEAIGHVVRRVHQRATSIFLDVMSETGLTPTQFAALAKLHDEGALSQNHLGRLTAMDPATTQGVIRRLVERGLIQRAADEADRRRAVLRLTKAGEELTQRAVSLGFDVTNRVLEPLSPRERARLVSLLERLV